MPLVIMITVSLTLLTAVVMSRQSAHGLSARRQIGLLESHHVKRGIQGAIDAWLRRGQSRPFRERIGPDGLIAEIEVSDGITPSATGTEKVRLSVIDAQDKVLVDFSGLQGQTLLDARDFAGSFKERSPEEFARQTRTLGPVAVSAASASAEVLSAALFAVTESANEGSEFVSSVMSMRGAGPMNPQAFNQAIIDAGLTPEKQSKLLRLVVPETSLWKLRADIVRGDTVIDGYDGLLLTEGRGPRMAGSSGSQRRSAILTLDRRKSGVNSQP
ncbi:MAG: hypothetical protein AABZ53_04310 [Planctomycetota bacterium]